MHNHKQCTVSRVVDLNRVKVNSEGAKQFVCIYPDFEKWKLCTELGVEIVAGDY